MTQVVEFKTTYPVGRDPIDWVCIAPAGESYMRTQTWHRIDRIRPKENADPERAQGISYQALLGRWSIIGPKYEAWKNSNEIPDSGMALAAWSGVTKEIADLLRRQGIRTVEDVAQMSPDAAAKLPMPNARKLPQMAKDFLASRNDAAAVEENHALKERIAAMEQMLSEMSEKRGPGRPKKVDAE